MLGVPVADGGVVRKGSSRKRLFLNRLVASWTVDPKTPAGFSTDASRVTAHGNGKQVMQGSTSGSGVRPKGSRIADFCDFHREGVPSGLVEGSGAGIPVEMGDACTQSLSVPSVIQRRTESAG